MGIKNGIRIQVIFLTVVSISICFAQTRPSSQRKISVPARAPFLQDAKSYEQTPSVEKVVFRNGMVVLVNEYRANPVVSIQAYVDTGLLNEPPTHPGLTELLAAMVHRGPSDRSMGTFRQKIQAIGGLFSAEINFTDTQFEIIAPSNQWKKALSIQADALLSPSLNEEELEIEKRLLVTKARAAMDNPEEFAGERLMELGFDQPRIGKWRNLAGGLPAEIKRESLTGFHKAMFIPSKITLVVSGDINSKEVLNEVANLYSKPQQTSSKQTALPLETTQKSFRYRAEYGDISMPYLLLGFHTVSEANEDFRSLEVLSAIMGLGRGSILDTRLKDQKELILAQETKINSYPGFGYLSIRMKVEEEKIDQSEIAVLAELELLKRNEPEAAVMERAFAQLELEYWKRLETATGRAQILAHFESMHDWKRMDRYVSEIRSVKPSDVKRVAGNYLRLENCSLLEYLPISLKERSITTESMQRTFEGLIAPAADQEYEIRSREVVLAIDIPSGTDNFKFNEMRHAFQPASILRGPDVFIREDHTAPVISMGFYFPGGKLAESNQNSGITELMLNLMLQGTKEKPGARFHRQLEIYGGQLQPVVEDDYFGFQFSILSRNFEAGFNLFQELIKKPEFNEQALRGQKEIQTAKIRVHNKSAAYPEQLVNQVLFGGFPYAFMAIGTEKSIEGVKLNSLQAWHETYVRNKKPIVAIIGDTAGTSLASYFVKYFSGSRFQDTKLSQDFMKPLEKTESVKHDWNKGQSLILIGFQAPSEDDEDVYSASLIQSYLGNLGRFSQEIRDRLGVAEISLIYAPRLRGGSIIVCATANAGSEEEAYKAIQDEIKRMKTAPINYHDLRSARNAAIGIYEIGNQARSEQIRKVIENVLAGKGLDGFLNYGSNLQAVTEEDFREVAGRVLNMEKEAIVRAQGKSE
jgi:zinc protease